MMEVSVDNSFEILCMENRFVASPLLSGLILPYYLDGYRERPKGIRSAIPASRNWHCLAGITANANPD